MRLATTAALFLAATSPLHAASWTFAGYADYQFLDENQTGLQMSQGLAWNADAQEWITSWQYGLARFSADGTFIAGNSGYDLANNAVISGIPQELADLGFDHIGDFDVKDGVIHASLDSAEGDYQNGHVAMFDATTLEYLGVLLPMIGDPTNERNDVASWTAIDHDTDLGYGKEWQSGNTINVYSLDDWAFLDTLEMDANLSKIQGAKIVDGMMYLASDNSSKSVYSLDMTTGHVIELFQLPIVAGAGNETEGIALRTMDDGTLTMQIEMVVNPGGGSEIDAYTRIYQYTMAPDVAPVPLPAALPLVLTGLGGFAMLRRRRRG